ncbi:MAG: hypothetical protein HWN68_00425 [Desulfobacterales bacterium]|nr:hypothetical protein [Desulfobacterales bacterium]
MMRSLILLVAGSCVILNLTVISSVCSEYVVSTCPAEAKFQQTKVLYGDKKLQTSFSESPLGVAFGFRYRGQIFMPYIKELGINLTKLYIYWQEVEPEKGKYEWRCIDNFLNQLDQDTEVLIALWSSSNWATKQKAFKGGSAPLNMNQYYRFVFEVVKHCQGKIRYWQNDCEPNSADFWKGSKEEFVTTLRAFYKAVKDADSKAQVIVGGHNGHFRAQTPGNQPFFDHVFKEAKDSFDVFDLRLYGDIYTVPDRVEWFRKRMRDFGFQKPIVCTEYGGPWPAICPDYPAWRRQFSKLQRKHGARTARRIIVNGMKKDREKLSPCLRMFLDDCSKKLDDRRHRIHSRDIVARTIMALSCGVNRLWYWNMTGWRGHIVFGKFPLMDERFDLRYPAFFAYQRMVEKLKGMKSVEQIKTRGENVYLFAIEKDSDKRLYVLWEKRDPYFGEDQAPTALELDMKAKKIIVEDVFGNQEVKNVIQDSLKIEITDTPLYFEAVE